MDIPPAHSEMHAWRFPAIAAAVLIATALICWNSSLTAYFAQDDFVLLEGSLRRYENAPGLAVWLREAFLRPGIMDVNYRPLSTHVAFLALQKIFGLRPLAFHALSLALHVFSALAILALSRRLGASRPAALVAGLYYVSCSALYSSVAWISGLQDGMATAFSLAALWLLAERIATGRRAFNVAAWAAAATALFCKESAILIPALGLATAAAALPDGVPRRWNAAFRLTASWWVTLCAFLILRQLATPPGVGVYQYALGVILPWRPGLYAAWTFVGWPILDLDRPATYLIPALAGYAILLTLAGLILRRLPRPEARDSAFRRLVCGAAWWTMGVGLVLFLRARVEMYYLSMPAAGAALALTGVLDGWLAPRSATRRMRRGVILAVGAALFLSGATLCRLKQRGIIESGGFYQVANAIRYRFIYDTLHRASPGLAGCDRVIFHHAMDSVFLLADIDGSGYRTVSPLDSMLRMMFNRPDLEVAYAIVVPDGDVLPLPRTWNTVRADSIIPDGLRETDLILGFDQNGRLVRKIIDLSPPPSGSPPASNSTPSKEDSPPTLPPDRDAAPRE